MNAFSEEVARLAAEAVETSRASEAARLDFSEASLVVIEDILAEAAGYASELTSELTPDQITGFVQRFGCYILEVGRREFGGRYCWFDQRNQPVLVVGEPEFRVALLAQDRVKGRLAGDESDNIPFFYAGFAERARRAEPGTDALYV
jgi:hypothetical protein